MGRYDLSEDALEEPYIAVVGAAARLPGAHDYFGYWRNLQAGVESIRRLSDDELRDAGVAPEELHDPNYVKACAALDRLAEFDAAFFGFSKREASVLDPQHRHFLEVCSEALENAGVRVADFGGPIGVFGGSGMNAYMPYNLFTNPALMRSMGLFLVRHTGNDKDFLTTRVSYCLNLQGPSVNIQTACSTSLVAIHAACQSLLAGECDVALAGGATIELPHHRGYRYEEGEILSPDGHCRPFDAESKGTVFGSGAGVVVLRRLKDAVEQGDYIHGVVLGSTVNNDGNRKVGYLAPSVDGQAECVVEALQVAGLSAREISYVECHGTGTPIGDPIELGALQRAFQTTTTEKQFCGIGSVKSNIGHLDTAAGVASFIKVLQMFEHEELVPTLHFEKPNPELDLDSTAFYVVNETKPWRRTDVPRRAGVSSLGVGGTNAHVIVEEAPRRRLAPKVEQHHPLILSARSPESLSALANRFAQHFAEHPELDLGEVSSTLLHGRVHYPHRRVLAARNPEEAREVLQRNEATRVYDTHVSKGDPVVVFLFPGGGAQYANMAKTLYESNSTFREVLERCFSIVRAREHIDLASVMFPEAGKTHEASAELERPSLALPALFSIELAYARVLESWGLTPTAMLGHSLGEYTAAHLSGVLSLDDALGIVCCRGRLFETVEPGGMLSVPLSPSDLEPMLGSRLSIAVTNAPEMSVVSGDNDALDALARALEKRDVETHRLKIHVPAHSPLLEPILDEFRAYLATIRFREPTVPYVSNRTADFMDPERIGPDYFVEHLRHTVRFSEGLSALLERYEHAILVEVGPGQALTSLVRQHPGRKRSHQIVPMSPHAKEAEDEARHCATSVGRILAAGAKPDPEALAKRIPRAIVPLPPTPFEHERHWVEPGVGYFQSADDSSSSERESDPRRWFYRSVFHEEPQPGPNLSEDERWLILVDEGALADSLLLELKARRIAPIIVTPDSTTRQLGDNRYTLNLADLQGYDELLQRVLASGPMPRRIVHALCLGDALMQPRRTADDDSLTRAFFSLLHLAQVLGQEDLDAGVELLIATSRGCALQGAPVLRPLHALVQGPALVIPKEIVEISARVLDVMDTTDPNALARTVVDETASAFAHELIAVRGPKRFVRRIEKATVDQREFQLPERPVVLFTGGLGGIARTLGNHFAETRNARLVLVTRRGAPSESEWHAERDKLDFRDPRFAELDWLVKQRAASHELLVVQGDVAKADDMKRVLALANEKFGHIDLVVHAAGIVDDQPLTLKDRESAEAVLRAKVLGSSALVEALEPDPPRALVLVGSSSALLGPPGQIDYVAANAFVNALAECEPLGLPGTRVLALNYGVWREVGMALAAARSEPPAPVGEPVAHPLLGRKAERETQVEFQAIYSPDEFWVLDEHRIRNGNPVLPGTAMLEIARAVAVEAALVPDGNQLEVSDLMFVAPLEVPDGSSRLVSITARAEAPSSSHVTSPSYELSLTSLGPDDDQPVEHARASISQHRLSTPTPLPIADIEARCAARRLEFEEGRQTLPQDEHLAFGTRWRVIRSARFGDGEAIARLELPEHLADDLGTMPLHPALMDMLSGFAFSLADVTGTGERVRVPLSYQRVRCFASLTRQLVSFVRLRSNTEREGIAVFDVDVADPTGRILMEIVGYTTKSVVWGGARTGGDRAREASLLDRWLEFGITCNEGIEVTELALANPSLASVTVTPVSPFALLEDLRPKVASRVVAGEPAAASKRAGEASPRDEVERQLAAMWCSLLGVDDVGIHDDFFELGGHSLIAVRLFSRIKKTYGVDLSLAVLFQAPTIEACAKIIRSELGVELAIETANDASKEPAEGDETRAAPTPLGREYRSLVPIQRGDGQYPMFVVHGAGGNVLNFRDLAVALGRDQSFYGVQARGVDGGEPNTTIEQMAEEYLAEIVKAVPNGPYLLAGYSGGGVVAFEMAQRLAAQGKRIAMLAFLDTFHPATKPKTFTFRERVQQLIEGGPGFATRRARGRVSRHLDELSTELKMRIITHRGLPLPVELRNIQMTRAFYGAADAYTPRPYDGKVILFRARMVAEPYRHVGPKLGWDDVIPNMEIVDVPGGHDSLVLEPNVQVLVARLRRVVQEEKEMKAIGEPLQPARHVS